MPLHILFSVFAFQLPRRILGDFAASLRNFTSLKAWFSTFLQEIDSIYSATSEELPTEMGAFRSLYLKYEWMMPFWGVILY